LFCRTLLLPWPCLERLPRLPGRLGVNSIGDAFSLFSDKLGEPSFFFREKLTERLSLDGIVLPSQLPPKEFDIFPSDELLHGHPLDQTLSPKAFRSNVRLPAPDGHLAGDPLSTGSRRKQTDR
jgi:hypothetical protein